jgi:hypothetical protein
MLDRGGEREVALALARESVALSGPAAYGRAELVDWLERAAPGPDALGTRLREAPVLVEGWLEAERTPPEGMARDFVVGMVAQLFPFDPGRWEAAGLPHAPWFSHPCWPLAGPPTTPDRAAPRSSWHRAAIPASHVLPSFPAELAHAVTGWVSGADWQGHDAEPGANDESGWRWTVTRWARWREGASRPTVRVELRASHRPSSPEKKRGGASATGAVDELICWNWFAGDEPGDALLLVQRDRRAGRRGSPGPYGAGWCVVGTDAFRVRAEAAIARCSPWRWEACAPEESLEPFPVTPVLPGVDTRGAPLEAAAASLDAALLPDDERSRVLELLSCRCVHPGIGFCAHRAELLDRTRAHRSLSQAAPTVRERTLARVAEAALEAAFYAAGANPNPESVHRAVERVRMELTTLAGLR